MSGNQTSGKEGGMQCVVMVVSVCMLDIVYIYPMKRETQACPSSVGQLPRLMLLELCTDSVPLTNEYRPSRAYSVNATLPPR